MCATPTNTCVCVRLPLYSHLMYITCNYPLTSAPLHALPTQSFISSRTFYTSYSASEVHVHLNISPTLEFTHTCTCKSVFRVDLSPTWKQENNELQYDLKTEKQWTSVRFENRKTTNFIVFRNWKVMNFADFSSFRMSYLHYCTLRPLNIGESCLREYNGVCFCKWKLRNVGLILTSKLGSLPRFWCRLRARS